MRSATVNPGSDPRIIAPLPGWITLAVAQGDEDVAFLSGAALACLHLVDMGQTTPHALWRARLALQAAEATVRIVGRREGAADLRDAAHLTRAGDSAGPGGEILRQWTLAVARKPATDHLARVLPEVPAERIAGILAAGQGGPVARAAMAIEAVLADQPRAEPAALILADATLARALGWPAVLPLLATGLKPRDLRLTGRALRLACDRALVAAAGPALDLAGDLARRVAGFQAALPRVRTKGVAQAAALFLTRDALAPSALTGFLSDRAARRLCERLVELGAVRELTGRDTFRLYGI